MTNNRKNFFSPALKIAGSKALLWGLAGLAVSAVAACFSGMHAHGLLNYGPATHNAAWIFAVEYLIIWLIPAAIFYGLGSALSASRIRIVDTLGTTAFALLPLAVTNLAQLMPGIKETLAAFKDPSTVDIAHVTGLVMQPLFLIYTLVLLAAFVLMLVWLFNAVRVSCNLRGWRLWTVYLIGLIGGDLICKLIIRQIY